MGRLFPIIQPIQITTGRVDTIPMRYERVDEFVTTVSITSGSTTATGTITLPSNVNNIELKSIRAFCTGYTFTIYVKDTSGQPIYAYSDASENLVDNNIAVPVTGNVTVEVVTSTAVTGDTSVDVKLGARYTVMQS